MLHSFLNQQLRRPALFVSRIPPATGRSDLLAQMRRSSRLFHVVRSITSGCVLLRYRKWRPAISHHTTPYAYPPSPSRGYIEIEEDGMRATRILDGARSRSSRKRASGWEAAKRLMGGTPFRESGATPYRRRGTFFDGGRHLAARARTPLRTPDVTRQSHSRSGLLP